MAIAADKIVPINQHRKSELLVSIRTAFLNTPLGQFPTIEKIFKDFGVDENLISLHEVYLNANREDWQGLRDANLEQRHQVSKKELELTLFHRNLELMQLLEARIKINQRLDLQYLTKGRVMSMDGSVELKNYHYDPRSITYFILALHEIYKSSTHTKDFIALAHPQSEKAKISPIMIEGIKNLEKLSEENLNLEIEKLDKLMNLLKRPERTDEDEIRLQNPWKFADTNCRQPRKAFSG